MAGTEISSKHNSVGSFPDGLGNAYLFSAFNAFSFQIVLGSPMVLYARSLGASATILGLIAGMMPLLVIFQIPAASHIDRIGFRRFVFAGWGVRVVFIFAMALVPLTGRFWDANNQLGLTLAILFVFNLSRGISSCAWLPWITALVPEKTRGRYLGRDAAVQNLASFITFLIAAAALSGQSKPWQFSALFLFSAVTGAISLGFLKRIPDVPISQEHRAGKGPVPWGAMLAYRPFNRLLAEVLAWSVAYGGMAAFTVAYLKGAAGMSEGRILLVTSASFLGGLSSLWLLGYRLDSLGSKPVLTLCCAAWAVVLLGWMTVAGGLLRPGFALVFLLQFLMGLLGSMVQMSNTRLAMAVIPVMGRNHFFAIYSVVANVTLGLAPIAWGLLIDVVGTHAPSFWKLEWNRFTVFFFGALLSFLVTLGLTRRLEEPKAVSTEMLLRDFLIQSPLRAILRLWPRA